MMVMMMMMKVIGGRSEAECSPAAVHSEKPTSAHVKLQGVEDCQISKLNKYIGTSHALSICDFLIIHSHTHGGFNLSTWTKHTCFTANMSETDNNNKVSIFTAFHVQCSTFIHYVVIRNPKAAIKVMFEL